MKFTSRRGIMLLTALIGFATLSMAQLNIFEIMERRDLRIDQIETLGKRYFDSTGSGQGTGFKQYQRWLYEIKFHLDDQGYILPADYEWLAYQKGRANMQIERNAAGAWTEKGPYSWTRTSGWNPGVGRITSISVYAADPNIIFITSPGGGVWKTTNGGTTWQPLTDANSSWMNMFSVTVDPLNANIVFAGSSGGTIIKSTDGGASWTQVITGIGTVRKILFHPATSQTLFAAANGGIYRSTNGGSTWTRVSTTSVEDIEFKPNDPGIMYASGSNVLRSTDGGLTWTTLGATQGIVASARTLIGVTPANPDIVYLVQANGAEFGRFYKSTDAGLSFTVTITGSSTTCTNFFGYETNGCGTGGQAGYDMAITVAPDNANEVYIAGIIVWKTTNGGSSFTAMTAWSLPNSIGYNHADVHVLEWVNSSIYSGSDGGIYRSNDRGDNWTDLSKGLGIRQFYRIANSKTVSTTFSGGAQDNGSSIHKSTGWIDWLGADGMDCLISPLDANLQWGTSQYGSLYRTTNGGSSYSGITEPATGAWVTPLAIESNTNVIYAGWNDVYKSTDNGVSWTNLTGSLISSNITALAVAPSNAQYIYASIGTSLYVTNNGGTSWSTYTAPASINAIAVSPLNPQKIWIACNSTANRVFVSTDAGLTLTNISSGMPAVTPRTIAVDDNTNESVYVGANLGVYYKDNNTTGWIDLSDNLPQVAINDVEIQKSGSLLRIGTYGRGAWERPLYGTLPPCNAPAGLNATSITTQSATLSWMAVGGALSYTVDYKASSSATWINAATASTSTSINLTGLTELTTYDWRVQSNCESNASSYATGQFTTLEACPPPGGLNTTGITTTTATLNWTAQGVANTYNVEYKTSSASIWTAGGTGVTGTSLSLSGLSPSTTYNWRIQSNCEALSGSWNTAQFTTAAPPVCNDAYESNNASNQAKSISIGTTITAGITTSTDVDWFKVTTANNSNTNIRVTLSNLAADFDVYLYDKNLVQRGAATTTGTGNEVIIFNSTAKRATYYVKVQGKSGAFNASYCYNLLVEANSTQWTGEAAPLAGADSDAKAPQLYPNPTSGMALLTFHSAQQGYADVRIAAASGATLKTYGIAVRQGSNQLSISTHDLPPGLYLVQVKNTSMRIIKPMMVVK